MPRASSSITVVLGVIAATLGAGFGTAWAAPSPTPAGGVGAGAPVEGKKVCTVSDSKLVELSGLVATKSGYVVINDATDFANRERVFFLDKKCKVDDSVAYPGGGPRDTEDLALSPDGKTLWVADTGNNVADPEDLRTSIVLWSLPVDGSKQPTLHRFVYPDKKPRDAEALVLSGTGAGTPLVITKSTGPAEMFVPAAAIKNGNATGVPMKKVGDLTLPKTDTPNLLSAAGRLTVTGAGRSPDGTKLVVRTYADAFEWDVAEGGDVVAALTGGATPRVTGLTDPFGEAISYTTDGKQFVTVSDGDQLSDDEEIEILSYPPAAAPPPATEAPAGTAAGDGGSFIDNLSLKDITSFIAAIGVIGLILVGAGVAGIMVARKKKKAAGDAEPAIGAGTARVGRQVAPEQATWDQDGPGGRVYGGQPSGGVYGGGGQSGAPAGGVYGGGGAQPAPPGGGVYGPPPRSGGGGGAGVYGGGGGQRGPGGGVYGGGGAPDPADGYGPPQQGGERPRGGGYGRQRSAPDDYGPDGYNGYVGSGHQPDYRG